MQAKFKDGVMLQDSANVLIVISNILDNFIRQHDEQKADDAVMAILAEIVQIVHFSESDESAEIIHFPSNLPKN